MKPISECSVCLVDHGLFIPVALRLAQTFKRVLYHSPCEAGFPMLAPFLIGDFPPIERCNDIWKVKCDVDIFVFPDIGYSGLQLELESQGYPVWGSRNGDSYEVSRTKFLRTLKEVGLPTPTYEVIQGLTALREHLQKNEDKFIKISRFRGLMETWHHDNYDTSKGRLDRLAVKLGPFQDVITFTVVDPLDTPIEIGGDTFHVRGQWPSKMLQGYEWKDQGFLGAVTERDDMPQQILDVLDAFGPLLGAENYSNFFSMELRDDVFIDPCCRGPLPGTGAQLANIANIDEVIYAGAQGQLVEPEMIDNFVAEAVLKAKGDKDDWGELDVPEKMLDFCRFGGCCRTPDGERIAFPPDDSHEHEVGWLSAGGDTIRSTIKLLLARAAELPKGLTADTRSMIDLLSEIQEAEKQGIEFTEQPVPEPEAVVSMEPA
jgi:hypothetical protein